MPPNSMSDSLNKETKKEYLAFSKEIKIISPREFTKVGKRTMPIMYIPFLTSYEYPMTLLSINIRKKQTLVEKNPRKRPFDRKLLALDGSLAISLIIKFPMPKKEINSKIQYIARITEYFPNSVGPNIRAINIAKIKKEMGNVIFKDAIASVFLIIDLMCNTDLMTT
jgi:hypothetical protein